MTRLVTAFLLAIGLLACSGNGAPKVDVLKPTFLEAIKPLQIRNEPVENEALEKLRLFLAQENDKFVNICTVSSINRNEHLWLTAAHCVTHGEPLFIHELPVTVVEFHAKWDIAVVKLADWTAKEIRLSLTAPKWRQEIMIAGYPFGYDDIFVTSGHIANPKAWIPGMNEYYMIFDVAAAPGNSGSPVLTMDGEIVSILQLGWGRAFSPISGGAPYEELRKFAERYFTPPLVPVNWEHQEGRPIPIPQENP